ncbi:MAG: autotransporter outer membrane beta-barrel domain-containing protein [Puniceicoccales bacterium]|jgi:outer membrane autotransporter protein|nr:autotransporter outer membrane beta-barrel domain-containing protein [Puniceicoccales bacterium]
MKKHLHRTAENTSRAIVGKEPQSAENRALPETAIRARSLPQAVLAAAASLALSFSAGAPQLQSASTTDFIKEKTISVSFGGTAITIGSPGAVQVAAQYWNLAGGVDANNGNATNASDSGQTACSFGTAAGLIDSFGVSTGVSVQWSAANTYGSAAGTSTAQGQILKRYLDDGTGGTDILGGGKQGPQVKLAGLDSLQVAAFDVYLICSSDTASSNRFEVNGISYYGVSGGTAQGTGTWTRSMYVNTDGPLTEGAGGSYLKVADVSPVGSAINVQGFRAGGARGPLAAVQIHYVEQVKFLTWNAGDATWDATTDNWLDDSTNPAIWSANTVRGVGVFDAGGANTVTLSGGRSAGGLWVKSGDLTLSGTGMLNLPGTALVAVENGAKLRIAGDADVSLGEYAVLELGSGSGFYAEKDLVLAGTITGAAASFEVSNGAAVTVGGQFSVGSVGIAANSTLSFTDSKSVTEATLSSASITNDGTLVLARGVDTSLSGFTISGTAGGTASGVLVKGGDKVLALGGTSRVSAERVEAAGGTLHFEPANADVGTLAVSAGTLNLSPSAPANVRIGLLSATTGGVMAISKAVSGPAGAAPDVAVSGANSAINSAVSQSFGDVTIGAGGRLAFTDGNAANRNLALENLFISGNDATTGLLGVNNLTKNSDGTPAGGALDFTGATGTTTLGGALTVNAGDIRFSAFATTLPLHVGSFSVNATGTRIHLVGNKTMESTSSLVLLTSDAAIAGPLPVNNLFDSFPDSAPSIARYLNAAVQLSADSKSVIVAFLTSWNDARVSSTDASLRTHAHGTFTIPAQVSFTVLEDLADRTIADPQFTAQLGWDGRTLTKDGLGTLVLRGANSYTGGTSVNGGVLSFADNGLGSTGEILLKNGGGLRWEAGSVQDISVGGRLRLGTGGGGFDTNGQTVVLSGGISGMDAFSGLTKQGEGTLRLTGPSTYAGQTIVAKGVLALAGSGSIDNSSLLRLGAGTTFDISGTGGVRVRAIEGTDSTSGAPVIELGSSSLQIGTDATSQDGDGTFAGVISGSGGSLVKNGTGTLVLSGQNTHDGGTTLHAGILQITSDRNLGAAYDASGAPGATLTLNGGGLVVDAQTAIARPVILGGGAVSVDAGAYPLQFTAGISGFGTLQPVGAGGLKISGDSASFIGTLLVPSGAGTLEVATRLGASGNFAGGITLDAGARLLFSAAGTQTLDGVLDTAATSRVEKGSAGELRVGVNADATAFAGDWFVSEGSVAFQALLGAPSAGANVFSGAIAISPGATAGFAASSGTQVLAGGLSGGGVLSKTGASRLVLDATADATGFSGSLKVSAGGEFSVETPLGARADGKNTFTGAILPDGAAGSVLFKLGENAWQVLAGPVDGVGIVKEDVATALSLERLSVLELTHAGIVSAPVEIRSGTLLIGEGTILGSASIGAGAALAGTGMVGALTLSHGAILSAGTLPRYSSDDPLPVPENDTPETLTIELPGGGTLDLNGVVLRVSLRDTRTGGTSASLLKVVGDAVYGTDGTAPSPVIDISAYGSSGAVSEGGWKEGSHPVLEATGTLTTDPGILATANFKYRGVSLSDSDRLSATLEQQGGQLILNTKTTGALDLQWNSRGPENAQPVRWAASNDLSWLSLSENAQFTRQRFLNGDAVTFGGAPASTDPAFGGSEALARRVNVSNAEGGLFVKSLTVSGGAYVFGSADDAGDGSRAKLAGIGLGGAGGAGDLLRIASGASATFDVDIDFARVEIAGGAVFNGDFTIQTGPATTLENGGLILADSATVGFSGAVSSALPVRVGNNARITLDATGGALCTAGLAGIELAAGAGVDLVGGGTGARLASPVTGSASGPADAGISKTGDGEFYLTTTEGRSNTYRGATWVQGGTLALGTAGATAASSAIILAPGNGLTASVRLDFAERGVLGPAIAGNGSLSVTGKAVLDKANTFSGSTTVSGAGAALELAAPDALAGSASVLVRDGGRLAVGAPGAITAAGARVSVGGQGSHLALDAGDALSANVSVEILDGGSLGFAASQTLGALTLANGVIADLGGMDLALRGVNASGGDSAGALASPLRNAGVVTVGGGVAAPAPSFLLDTVDALAGAAGVVVKSKATLKAAAAQSFGSLHLEQGAFFDSAAFAATVGSGALSGVFKAAAFTKNGGGTLVVGTPLLLAGEATVESGLLSIETVDALAAASRLVIAPGGSLATGENQSVAALTVLPAAENSGASVDFGGADLTVLGGVETQSEISRPVKNLGVFTLGGAGLAPVLRLSASDALASASLVALRDGTLVADGGGQRAASLGVSASATLRLASSTLSVGAGEILGVLEGDASSALVKDGSGVLRLAPALNHFGGETIVRSGALEFADDGALGAGRRMLDGADASLRLTGTAYGAAWDLGRDGGALLASGPVGWSGVISGTGPLAFGAFAAAGVPNAKPEALFTLAAATTHSGTTTLHGGAALHLSVPDALAQSAGVTVAADAGALTASAPQVFRQLNVAPGASFAFSAAPGAAPDGAIPDGRDLTVNAGVIAGRLEGVANLAKGGLEGATDGGTLSFTGLTAAAPLVIENTFTVSAGTLSIPLSSAGPTVVVDTLAFAPSASLDITGFYDGTTAIGDPLRLTLIETRSPIAAGAFPAHYAVGGATAQNFATVQIERGLADRHVVVTAGLAWYDGSVNAAGSLDRAHGSFEVAREFTLAAVLSDRAEAPGQFLLWDGRSLEKTGVGTLVLAAKNTYSGPTVVRNGSLVVNGLLGSKAVPLGASPAGNYGGALRVEAAGSVIFDTVYEQELSGVVGGGTFAAVAPGGLLAPVSTLGGSIIQRGTGLLRVSGTLAHAGALAVERGSSAEFLADAAVGGLFTGAGTVRFSGSGIRLAKLSVPAGGLVEFAPAAAGTGAGAVRAAADNAGAPAIVIGEASISGSVRFLADATIDTPLVLAGASSRVEIAAGKILDLRQGGTLATALQGEGWTLRSGTSGDASAALEARAGLAGSLVLAGGSASITGDINGSATTAQGTRLETTGAVRGFLDNRGAANVRGILHGGADNHAGASLAIDNIRNRLEVRGNFRNSGLVTFASDNGKLLVENLSNAATGAPGYYSLTLDAATPAFSSHIEVVHGGLVDGSHYFIITGIANAEAVTPESTFELIRPELPGDLPLAADADIRLAQPLNIGLTQFDIPDRGGATMRAVAPSSAIQGILATVASQATGWFSQLDSVAKRFGDLRLEPPATKRNEDDSTEHFWFRAHGLRANAKLEGIARFSEEQYGAEAGADHAFEIEGGHAIHLGAFVGYQGARRRHSDGYGSKSSTDSPALGVYTTYLHPKGLYADGVLMARYSASDFVIHDNQGLSSADYNSSSLGLSLEVGWAFALPAKWSLTPAAHLAYTAEYGKSFDTSDSIHVKITDGLTVRWGLSFSLARAFTLQSGARLQPYLRGTYDEQDTYGANVSASKGSSSLDRSPNTDGGRLSVAAGVSWQLNASHQLHFEYETGWGRVYDVPWSLNAGWRMRF